MSTYALDEALLQKAVSRLVKELEPQKILLFGSHTTGIPGPHSDVDLLVVMETDMRPAARIRAVSRILSPRPFPVDILVRTPDELKRDMAKVDPFISEILERGRVLYEHS